MKQSALISQLWDFRSYPPNFFYLNTYQWVSLFIPYHIYYTVILKTSSLNSAQEGAIRAGSGGWTARCDHWVPREGTGERGQLQGEHAPAHIRQKEEKSSSIGCYHCNQWQHELCCQHLQWGQHEWAWQRYRRWVELGVIWNRPPFPSPCLTFTVRSVFLQSRVCLLKVSMSLPFQLLSALSSLPNGLEQRNPCSESCMKSSITTIAPLPRSSKPSHVDRSLSSVLILCHFSMIYLSIM